MVADSEKKKPSDILLSVQQALRNPALELLQSNGIADYIKRTQEALPGNALLEQMRHLPSYQMSRMLSGGLLGGRELLARSIPERLDTAAGLAKHLGTLNIGGLADPRVIEGFRNYRDFSLGVGWAEQQKNSLLFNYLTSHKSETLIAIEKLQAEFASIFSKAEPVVWEELPIEQPELEREIVEVINGGGDFSSLSNEAKKYFAIFWTLLWDILNKAAIVGGVIALTLLAQEKLEGANTSIEIRQVVKSIPEQRREFLSGNSVVTGNDVIIRAKADKGSSELGRLKIGTWVENLGREENNWIYVSIDIGGESVKGWIARRYLIAF